MQAVRVGYDVVGFDIEMLNVSPGCVIGRSLIDDIRRRVAEATATGRYHPSSRRSRLASFDIAVITVPTPWRRGAPDLSTWQQLVA